MGTAWLLMLGLHLHQTLGGPYPDNQQGSGYQQYTLYPQVQYGQQQAQFSSPLVMQPAPIWPAPRADPNRLNPSIFDLDLKSLAGLPSTSRGNSLPPLTNIDTASNAIFPLTDITADTSQTAKNSEQTISIYQDTLTKMYREVTAQKESIKKSQELILKLTQVQANNKKILEKNMATVKKYSAGLVTIVTQYTESLDMAGGAPTPAGEAAAGGDKAEGEGEKKEGEGEKAAEPAAAGGEDDKKSFMEKLAQLKRHAVLGMNL